MVVRTPAGVRVDLTKIHPKIPRHLNKWLSDYARIRGMPKETVIQEALELYQSREERRMKREMEGINADGSSLVGGTEDGNYGD